VNAERKNATVAEMLSAAIFNITATRVDAHSRHWSGGDFQVREE
jgi:hypothetical protein